MTKEAQIAILMAALEYYADPYNYGEFDSMISPPYFSRISVICIVRF